MRELETECKGIGSVCGETKMKELEIGCKGIGNVSFQNYSGAVTLQEVDMSFLEDLPASVIVANHNNEALLKAMDYDDICEYLESHMGIRVHDVSNCCNEPIIRDTDLCSKCKEHAENLKITKE